MSSVCDVAVPRVRANPPRRPVYWWSDEIRRLPTECGVARRQYTRARRRRNNDAARTTQLYAGHRTLTKQLLLAIRITSMGASTHGDDEQVVGTLFSSGEVSAPAQSIDRVQWSQELEVSVEELAGAVRCIGERNTAPGPDGRMVLLREDNRPAESPSVYRPIVLLDEVGKLFECTVQRRLVQHLPRDGLDLAEFGFREGRSTIDAISRVSSLSDSTTAIVCGGHDGSVRSKINCGVPEVSVLGPLLWNLRYDEALRVSLLVGMHLTCYADDTMVLATGRDLRRTSVEQSSRLRPSPRKFGALGWSCPLRRRKSSVSVVWLLEFRPALRSSDCQWRRAAIRFIRGYRTVSFEAATTLTGLPLSEYLALEEAYIYSSLRIERQVSSPLEHTISRDELKLQARRFTMPKWRDDLSRHEGHWIVGAILPILDRWAGRSTGRLTFRATERGDCAVSPLWRHRGVGDGFVPRAAEHTIKDAWSLECMAGHGLLLRGCHGREGVSCTSSLAHKSNSNEIILD
ncbi:uncharacterized protein LOC143425433 [Xylocopa sonorina]|uniref:uncharacterized protein LOC143425433 n=1 Tax=Xylocopa sonorina TaxID=1818115 RepID=UPI00403A9DE4